MADVDVPGLGAMNKTYVYGGVGLAAAYVGYRWWKSRSSAPAAAAAAGSSATTGVPGDLGTGTAGMGAGGAYVNPAPGLPGSATYQSGSATGSAPQTNEAWTAAVVSDLSNLGYNPQTVAEALAAYLGGQQLTTDQMTTIRLAFAYEGRPPANPSLTPVPSTTSTATTSGPTVATQDVTVNVGHNTPVQQVINDANALGYAYTWADFWADNPSLPQGDLQNVKGTWTLTSWSTPVTIQKAGHIEDPTGIGGDYNPSATHPGNPTYTSTLPTAPAATH